MIVEVSFVDFNKEKKTFVTCGENIEKCKKLAMIYINSLGGTKECINLKKVHALDSK